MNLAIDFHAADLVRIVCALVVGAIIGGEREYRSKAAGFRTMTLICLGSTLFTILSLRLGGDAGGARIAANIITGIGFLGAGVIFKDGFSVSGLTTATSIWVTAALGMAIGAGELALATIGLALVLIVLALFDRLQEFIDRFHQKRSYRLQFSSAQFSLAEIERTVSRFSVSVRLRRVVREAGTITCWYDVWGSQHALHEFSDHFATAKDVLSVEYSA